MKYGGRMPVRERERLVMVRREKGEPGHRDDVRQQDPEDRCAAHRVERVHALATHDGSGSRFTKHRHGPEVRSILVARINQI